MMLISDHLHDGETVIVRVVRPRKPVVVAERIDRGLDRKRRAGLYLFGFGDFRVVQHEQARAANLREVDVKLGAVMSERVGRIDEHNIDIGELVGHVEV
jgi:hypothetical protein